MRRIITGVLFTCWIIGNAVSPGVAGLVSVDGKELVGALPITRDSRVLVPLRSIFEALGATVKYDDATKMITATKGSTAISLTVNSPIAEVDGNSIVIDVPPQVIQGRVYVPVRFIGTSLGATVKYYGETDSVVVSTKAVTPVTNPVAADTNLSVTAGNPTKMTQDEFAKAIEVIKMVNEERRKKGIAPLTYQDVCLFDAAYARAKELPESFSHTRPDGSQFPTCFPTVDYKITGENLAKNFNSPGGVIEGWLGSTGHREAMLDSSFSSTAVGVYSYGGTYYWVEFFIGK